LVLCWCFGVVLVLCGCCFVGVLVGVLLGVALVCCGCFVWCY
jgi:hypothetical protein